MDFSPGTPFLLHGNPHVYKFQPQIQGESSNQMVKEIETPNSASWPSFFAFDKFFLDWTMLY